MMGGADAVPGVSGATIALIIGIYPQFIASLHEIIRAPSRIRNQTGRKQLRDAFVFLVPLGIGILLAYYLASKLLVGPTDRPGLLRRPFSGAICYGFLFSLVLFSLGQPWKTIRAHSVKLFIVAILGAVLGAWFVGISPSSDTGPLWVLLLAGAGAIAMMLLPGVSGSLFLLIIGQYQRIHRAVQDLDFQALAVFLAGIVIGIVLFVPMLKKALEKFHDFTMAALTGLMAGSLRALWPWKSNYDAKKGPMLNIKMDDPVLWVLLSFVCGGLTVLLLVAFEKRLAARAIATTTVSQN